MVDDLVSMPPRPLDILSQRGATPNMSAELKPDGHLEIGHILFIDVVGYSKLYGEEQKRAIRDLNDIVRSASEYDRARAELALAARALPNSSRVFELTGYIDRRQGRWEEAARNLEKALQLHSGIRFAVTRVSNRLSLRSHQKTNEVTSDE
jgi:tetratricopeptide (TPR) repeat protein